MSAVRTLSSVPHGAQGRFIEVSNCRITTPAGAVVTEFSVDHRDPAERRYLGAKCTEAFETGHKVETWPDGIGFDDASLIKSAA